MQDPVTIDQTAQAVTPAAPSTQNGASSPDMLTQSEWTRRLVALASVVVVGLSILAIVAVMCYRVILDGNSSLTNDITTKLMWIALVGVGSMITALFGANSLIAKAIDKLV